MNRKRIYLAGGCYWGTQHFLKQIPGIEETKVGFANGDVENPTYEQVCQHTTGFAETVEVVYDVDKVSLNTILRLYFKTIDPTSVNKQGEDEGDQYRTGIYYVEQEDEPIIREAIAILQQKYNKPIAIEVLPLRNYYPAHEAHQDYLDKNPQGYCHVDPSLFALAKKGIKALED